MGSLFYKLIQNFTLKYASKKQNLTLIYFCEGMYVYDVHVVVRVVGS